MLNGIALQIMILDDHELMAYGIKSRLELLLPNAGFDIVNMGLDVKRLLREKSHDLYIVDIELKDISGFEVIKDIRSKYPKSNILVHTLHEGLWYIKELKELMINGILFKSDCHEYLDKAVINILSGHTFLSDRFKDVINKKNRKGIGYLLHEDFTDNERDVLSLIGKGYTIKSIAEEKSWSVKTVEYYRKRLFDKFDVPNAPRLVAVAVREGFIKMEDI
ncbi:MAG: response regulator transcription factor [Tannerella sp.]|jgi:DNA-binding NarL/FixJ family response regulator|nr:response regulator transcription factor [Tannerella sp.]